MTTTRNHDAPIYPVHLPDPDRWAEVLEAVHVGEACPCSLTQADGPGRVPDGYMFAGNPLTIAKIPGDTKLWFQRSPSCSSNALDYTIHEGRIGEWYAHKERRCTTDGATSFDLQPQAGDRYYLVVPINTVAEGSYGTDSSGNQRPLGDPACMQVVLDQTCIP